MRAYEGLRITNQSINLIVTDALATLANARWVLVGWREGGTRAFI